MMEFYVVQIPEILALKLKYLKLRQKALVNFLDDAKKTFYPDKSSGATGIFMIKKSRFW